MPEEELTEPQTDQPPQESSETQEEQGGGFGPILTPEGIMMLLIAGILDIISVIPFVNIITDIVGMCVVGLWLIVRGRRPQRVGRGGRPVTRSFKWLGRFGTFFLEFIPGFSILPLWTLLVYGELKSEA